MTPEPRTRVLVLGGGPDAEHAVSLESSRAVADALAQHGGFEVHREVVGALTQADLAALPGEVIFPVLHGPWGEGGRLQRLLEGDGRPFVGCGSRAARAAIDKMFAKQVAITLGIPTPPAAVFHPTDDAPPLDPPLVLKPVHEGSSVGLHICRSAEDWHAALPEARASIARRETACFMAERFTQGRELTVGVLAGRALPLIEIAPSAGVYDFAAKYERDDTTYAVAPGLPPGVTETLQQQSLALADALGCGAICRVDFILDGNGRGQFLEANTMPGFTAHSLLPMAAAHDGLDMPAICGLLVERALAHTPDAAGRSA
ncbi:MAG: D-alanine--D-alanine ligase [Planctomycetota bacterium]